MCSCSARNCVRAELRMSVLAGMIGAPPFGSFPRNTCSVLAGEERSWEGGEGRVQAERPTRTRPQGQGNGPEGERHTELDRSPCPGRRCPCGCPQQVDRLDHPLARGVARLAPGWLPTIMAGPAQPCPQRDETHHGSPQTWLVASRRTDRALYPEAGLDLLPGDGALLDDLSTGGVGGLVIKTRLGLPPLPSLRCGSL